MAQVYGINTPNVIGPLAGIAEMYGMIKGIERQKEQDAYARDKDAREYGLKQEQLGIHKDTLKMQQDAQYRATPSGQVAELTKMLGGDDARAWQIVGQKLYQNTMDPDAKDELAFKRMQRMMGIFGQPTRGAVNTPLSSIYIPPVSQLPMGESELPS